MVFNVHNLVKWFQIKYPGLVKTMMEASHHYTQKDADPINGSPNIIIEPNPYHLEGSIFTHTMMVVLQASQSKYKDTNETVYNQILICALLHDIGKPMARRENHEKKRVNFYSHEPLSAFLAIDILRAIEDDFKIIVDKRVILEAIAMHTDVFKLSKEKLEDRLVSNPILSDVLMALSTADHSGRFYDMGDRITEGLVKKHKDYESKPHSLIMNIGLPCAGKSTSSKKNDYQLLSRDQIVLDLAKEKGIENYNEAFEVVDQKEVDRLLDLRAREIVKSNSDVLIDMTNMGRKSRRKRMALFGKYHKTAHVYMTSILNIEQRNKLREGKTIPPHVIEKMVMSFYPPMYDEFDEIHWIFNG